MRVKWCCANLPMIIQDRLDKRLYLTKRELSDLRDEISEFIEYYKDDFSEDQIDITHNDEFWF